MTGDVAFDSGSRVPAMKKAAVRTNMTEVRKIRMAVNTLLREKFMVYIIGKLTDGYDRFIGHISSFPKLDIFQPLLTSVECKVLK